MKNSTFRIVAALVAFLVIIMFMMIGADALGLPANTTETIIIVMPGIFIFFIGVGILIKTGTSVFALPAFASLGIGLAILLSSIETAGIYPITSAGGATIEQVQWLIIILCSLIGGAVAAISSRN